jgi:hypothetical protein
MLLTLVLTIIAQQVVGYKSGAWDDHDPDCHGDPWELRLMKDPVYEDDYKMSCCGRRPYQSGCVVSRHKAKD